MPNWLIALGDQWTPISEPWSGLEYCYSPLDGILVIQSGRPNNSPVPIYTSGWRVVLRELSIIPENTMQWPLPGLEPRPLHPETRAPNHQATAPPTSLSKKDIKYKIDNKLERRPVIGKVRYGSVMRAVALALDKLFNWFHMAPITWFLHYSDCSKAAFDPGCRQIDKTSEY